MSIEFHPLGSYEYDYLYQWLTCQACGKLFGVFTDNDPADWPDCLGEDCPSYDPKRDPFGVVDGPDGLTLLDK